jgi:23S rRNA pseudouridine1911/1915/1917 synthase
MRKSYILRAGDLVLLRYVPSVLQPIWHIPLKIIYEDGDVLVLDKPPGLVVHPTPTQNKPSLVAALIAQYPQLKKLGDEFRPGIVHRLDADTSGLLIVAKNFSALDYLKRQFAQRRVKKIYLALVHGILEKPHGEFNMPVGRQSGSKRFSAGFGRAASTEYWVEQIFPAFSNLDSFSLVRVQLHTGRTHQIRVHFSTAGHPIAGDRLYGGRFKKTDSKIFARQFLHAESLELILPYGKFGKFTSPLPEDLRSVLFHFKSNQS